MRQLRARKRASVAGILAIALATVLFGSLPASSASSVLTFGNGVIIPTPGGIATNSVLPIAISCVNATNCTAVGKLTNSAGEVSPVAFTESNGRWGNFTSLTLPAGSVATGVVNELEAVSCFSIGNCVAVGRYVNAEGGQTTAMAVTEVNGTWGPVATVPQPSNGNADPSYWLSSLSCPTTTNCSAVGTYFTTTGALTVMVATDVAGVWSATALAPVTGDVVDSSDAVVWSISCPAVGSCVAGGATDASTNTAANSESSAVAVESSGTWGTIAPVTAATNTMFYDVSCPAVGACAAIGASDPSDSDSPLLYTESGSSWTVRTPTFGAANPHAVYTEFGSISCPSVGNCVAVGTTGAGDGVFSLVERAGVWAAPTHLPTNLPTALPLSVADTVVTGVACSSPSSCTASGFIDASDTTTEAVVWTATLKTETTLVCVKGKHTTRVTAVSPKCPAGYKPKK